MPQSDAAASGFSRLGLLTDPFTPLTSDADEVLGLRLGTQALVSELLIAVERASERPADRLVLVERTYEMPVNLQLAALCDTLEWLAKGDPLRGVFPVYVTIDTMKQGRVRAVLSVAAERIAGDRPDLTIAAWTRIALLERDEALPEWNALTQGADVLALLGAAEADPEAFSARFFGDVVESRTADDDFEALMKISTARQELLENDPAEADAPGSDESDVDDPMREVFTTPLGEVTSPELAPAVDAEEELLVAYVLAYTSAHLSPVVARGIQAFRAQGSASMSQELKITKAPTKTLNALIRFALTRHRYVALMFDRFSLWESAPADLRDEITASIQKLSRDLGEHAVSVAFVEPELAPEIEQAFSAGQRVVWGFSGLESLLTEDAVYDPDIARAWLHSASLGESLPEWTDELLGSVPAGTPLADATAMLTKQLAEREGVAPPA